MSRSDVSELAIFGIRHHGPGSARSVERALAAFAPDVVLVEGPTEADGILALAADDAMRPPVAILGYAVDDLKRALFYPFASFSPEWRAIRYGVARGVPVHFMDLPLANVLAGESPPRHRRDERDPLDDIAAGAGFVSGERWWDAFVERRRNDADAFAALEELMGVMRAARAGDDDVEERRREAAMRRTIRAAAKRHERVAVVCGAWHAPALREPVTAKSDDETLRDLPKVKVAVTWIPWTHGRLAFASGYGAGIESPGWYEHLFESDDAIVPRWMTKAARALRDEHLDVAAAHAIEATRLAETLASLRDLPLAGLDELTDAIRTVYCFGNAMPLALLHERLVIGERLGAVPHDVANVPLLADLAREQRRLRLAPEVVARDVEFDLRKPNDLDRSRLLHRLQLLGVPWGRVREVRGAAGTFREAWTLRWDPEFALALIETSASGNTVADAAESRTRDRAAAARDLAELAALLDASLRAHVPAALDDVLRRVGELAAATHDAGLLLDAVPPLAKTLRYGDVRQTDATGIAAVLELTIARACIALPVASLALDDDAATASFGRLVAVDLAIRTLDVPSQRAAWDGALATLARDERVHGFVAGRAARLLFDARQLDESDVRRALGRALARGSDPARAAAWLEGAFRDSGLILVHQTGLLAAVDAWLSALDGATFLALLPLVRRTFATFAPPERAALAARVTASASDAQNARPPVVATDATIDWERACLVVPALAEILGSERGRS